jgi:hypothetical protein
MEKVILVTNIPVHRVIMKNQKCGIYIDLQIPLKLSNQSNMLMLMNTNRAIGEQPVKNSKGQDTWNNIVY